MVGIKELLHFTPLTMSRHKLFKFVKGNTSNMVRILSTLLSAIGLAIAAMLVASMGLRPVRAQAPTATAGNSLIWPLSGTSTPDVASSPFGPRW